MVELFFFSCCHLETYTVIVNLFFLSSSFNLRVSSKYAILEIKRQLVNLINRIIYIHIPSFKSFHSKFQKPHLVSFQTQPRKKFSLRSYTRVRSSQKPLLIYLLGLDEKYRSRAYIRRHLWFMNVAQILHLRVPRDGRKVEDDILSHGRFPSKYQLRKGRENKGGEKKSEERREMAPGCSTERRPPPRWRIKGQRGSRLLHKRLRDPRARYFSPSFPSAGRGNRLRKARARQVWQINEIPAATVNNNTTVPANQAVASSCRPIFSDYKCHGCSTAGGEGGKA